MFVAFAVGRVALDEYALRVVDSFALDVVDTIFDTAKRSEINSDIRAV